MESNTYICIEGGCFQWLFEGYCIHPSDQKLSSHQNTAMTSKLTSSCQNTVKAQELTSSCQNTVKAQELTSSRQNTVKAPELTSSCQKCQSALYDDEDKYCQECSPNQVWKQSGHIPISREEWQDACQEIQKITLPGKRVRRIGFLRM